MNKSLNLKISSNDHVNSTATLEGTGPKPSRDSLEGQRMATTITVRGLPLTQKAHLLSSLPVEGRWQHGHQQLHTHLPPVINLTTLTYRAGEPGNHHSPDPGGVLGSLGTTWFYFQGGWVPPPLLCTPGHLLQGIPNQEGFGYLAPPASGLQQMGPSVLTFKVP